MKARAGVSLAIVTTVEVEVEFELQVSSIFQQILKKGLNLNSKRALGLQFNCIWAVFLTQRIILLQLVKMTIL